MKRFKRKKAYYSRTADEGHNRWMSHNANLSYDNGEMPIYKWKTELGINDTSLLMEVLEFTAWHHTGKFAMRTDFYRLREQNEIDFNRICSLFPKSKRKFWSKMAEHLQTPIN